MSRLTFGIAILARSAFLLLTVAFSATAFAAVKNDVRLIDAVKNGDAAAVRTYLKGKPNVNVRYPDGTTALHWAAHRVDADLVKLLIKAGADVNAVQQDGVTPLHAAARNGRLDLVQLLLEHGADRASRDGKGRNAADRAREGGHTEIAEFLES